MDSGSVAKPALPWATLSAWPLIALIVLLVIVLSEPHGSHNTPTVEPGTVYATTVVGPPLP